jgi:hypothetical protein
MVPPRIKRFWFAVFGLPALFGHVPLLPFVGITCTYERWVALYQGVAGDLRDEFRNENGRRDATGSHRNGKAEAG